MEDAEVGREGLLVQSPLLRNRDDTSKTPEGRATFRVEGLGFVFFCFFSGGIFFFLKKKSFGPQFVGM